MRVEKLRGAVLGIAWISMVLTFVTLLMIQTAFAGEYQGGGYRVTIEGFAGDAKYTGCDPKGRCLTVEPASFYELGSYIWEKNGYTYSMMSAKKGDGSYILKIFDPSGKVILKQPMTPVSGASK